MMKKVCLLAMAVFLMLSGTAFAETVGLMIVPKDPVKVNNEVVKAIAEAFSSEFPGYKILPAVAASGDAIQAQDKLSIEITAGNWDYGALVKLEMTRVTGTVVFFQRKMAVTATANFEISSRNGSFFNRTFESKAVGNASANYGPLFLQALNETLRAFKEAFGL
jgi:hypothetical protein